jgi:hypothetical protein
MGITNIGATPADAYRGWHHFFFGGKEWMLMP